MREIETHISLIFSQSEVDVLVEPYNHEGNRRNDMGKNKVDKYMISKLMVESRNDRSNVLGDFNVANRICKSTGNIIINIIHFNRTIILETFNLIEFFFFCWYI